MPGPDRDQIDPSLQKEDETSREFLPIPRGACKAPSEGATGRLLDPTPPPGPASPGALTGTALGILTALHCLVPEGSVTELRGIGFDGRIASGYFCDMQALAKNAARLDASGMQGLYITLNEVNPALLARRADRVKTALSRRDATTSDGDILSRRWLPVDIDPDRPSGVSSTDREHEAALEIALRIRDFLAGLGFPEPIMADSGNGAHLLYAVALPNDESSHRLVGSCLTALDTLFSGNGCTVDATNHNAARIWKLYGTMGRKGDNTKDRPHRRSRLLHVPGTVVPVPVECLETLAGSHGAAKAPSVQEKPSRPANPGKGRGPGIDLGSWLPLHGYRISSEKPCRDGTLYVLDDCPFSAEHRDGAFAIQFGSGAVYAGCHHQSCGTGKNRWKELLDRSTPGADAPGGPRTPAVQVGEGTAPCAPEPAGTDEADEETLSAAVDLLEHGDPFVRMLEVFASRHIGDETLAACLILSLASQCVGNTSGLHVSVTGESGKGKSHAFSTMLEQVPLRYRLKGAMSNRALFYMEGLLPGSVIVLDDKTLSDDLQEILKEATSAFSEPVRYRTVNKDRKGVVCTIPERCVWWIDKVEGCGDDQVANRMLTCWIDDTNEQDERVVRSALVSAEQLPGEGSAGDLPGLLICRAAWELLRSSPVYVVIPYASRIRFPDSKNRRNCGILLDLVRSHAALFMKQRSCRSCSGVTVIEADDSDFEVAGRLYSLLSGEKGDQVNKMTKGERSLLEAIVALPDAEFTIQDLQAVTGRSYSTVYRWMHGYEVRSRCYCGLTEKCPAITWTDRTVPSPDENGNVIRRRTNAYQFDASVYASWKNDNRCWIEPVSDESIYPTPLQHMLDKQNEGISENGAINAVGTGSGGGVHQPAVTQNEAGKDTSPLPPLRENEHVGVLTKKSLDSTDIGEKSTAQPSFPIQPRLESVGNDGFRHPGEQAPENPPVRTAVPEDQGSGTVTLPGVIPLAGLTRCDRDLGRCQVCDKEKVAWWSREDDIRLCNRCYLKELVRGRGSHHP